MRISHILLLPLALAAGAAVAQPNCRDTPEGRICSIPQSITAGTVLGAERERQLGLITVSGGCSGTLLNRWWVLTARHCVTTNGSVSGPLQALANVTITATWAPGQTASASRIHELAPNVGVAIPSRDMVLVYFGQGDLGPVDRQRILITQRQVTTVNRWVAQRLKTTDTVTQYGRGFSSFASGVFGGTPPAVAAQGIGTYRSGRFAPSNVSATHYDLAMNTSSQVGHGGDSGGPTVKTENGLGVGIAGVQSTCVRTGIVPGAPATNWTWATGISSCTYVSVEPMVREIGRTILENPECKAGPACALPAILGYAIDSQETPAALPAILSYEID